MDKGKGALALFTVPAVVVSSMFAFILLIAGGNSGGCTVPGATVDAASIPTTAIDGYSGVQLQNAAAIMNAADSQGMDLQAQLIGVMTAMGESQLQVLDHGDTAGPDSRGLFQQRSSWGTLAQRMDPTQSATLFFQKLKTVPDWQTLDPSIAAHPGSIGLAAWRTENSGTPGGNYSLSDTVAGNDFYYLNPPKAPKPRQR